MALHLAPGWETLSGIDPDEFAREYGWDPSSRSDGPAGIVFTKRIVGKPKADPAPAVTVAETK